MKKSSILKQSAVVCLLVASLGFAAPEANAYHDRLIVFVNGVRLTPPQIRHVETLIGRRMRSGNYWYNAQSGFWGLVGGPALGRIQPMQTRRPSPNRRRTLTERYGSWYTDIWR